MRMNGQRKKDKNHGKKNSIKHQYFKEECSSFSPETSFNFSANHGNPIYEYDTNKSSSHFYPL